MKREQNCFDKVHARQPFDRWFFSSLDSEQAEIVAHYTSGFSSSRDALLEMKGDRAHIPGGCLSDTFEDQSFGIDAHAVLERNRMIDDVANNLGYATLAETRFARRELDSLLRQRNVDWARDPTLIAVTAKSRARRQKSTLVFAGPSQDPTIHALAWMRLIVMPTLIAHENPDAFYALIVPRLYGNAFQSFQARCSSDAIRSKQQDGGSVDVGKHEQRLAYYESQLARHSAINSREARSIARRKTTRHFGVGEEAIKKSLKIARYLRRRASIPPDGRDLFLAAGQPVFIGPHSIKIELPLRVEALLQIVRGTRYPPTDAQEDAFVELLKLNAQIKQTPFGEQFANAVVDAREKMAIDVAEKSHSDQSSAHAFRALAALQLAAIDWTAAMFFANQGNSDSPLGAGPR